MFYNDKWLFRGRLVKIVSNSFSQGFGMNSTICILVASWRLYCYSYFNTVWCYSQSWLTQGWKCLNLNSFRFSRVWTMLANVVLPDLGILLWKINLEFGKWVTSCPVDLELSSESGPSKLAFRDTAAFCRSFFIPWTWRISSLELEDFVSDWLIRAYSNVLFHW